MVAYNKDIFSAPPQTIFESAATQSNQLPLGPHARFVTHNATASPAFRRWTKKSKSCRLTTFLTTVDRNYHLFLCLLLAIVANNKKSATCYQEVAALPCRATASQKDRHNHHHHHHHHQQQPQPWTIPPATTTRRLP